MNGGTELLPSTDTHDDIKINNPSLTINYNSPREIKAFMESRLIAMRKKFGQNFLINPDARKHLLDALDLSGGEDVWEIGPGLGAMTVGLLERGLRVKAFEIDAAFSGILLDMFSSNPAFSLVKGDVMKTWQREEAKGELYLFGNLPYNIGAALLSDFIEKGRFFKRIVVTVQREVARRMAAKPDTSDYSSFSILCSSVYKVSLLNIIKGPSFYPAPNVDSQGVRLDLLDPEESVYGKSFAGMFYPLVRGLFSSRRKTIRNSLSAFIANKNISTTPSMTAENIFHKTGISGDRRPETLGIEDFALIAASLDEVKNEEPKNREK